MTLLGRKSGTLYHSTIPPSSVTQWSSPDAHGSGEGHGLAWALCALIPLFHSSLLQHQTRDALTQSSSHNTSAHVKICQILTLADFLLLIHQLWEMIIHWMPNMSQPYKYIYIKPWAKKVRISYIRLGIACHSKFLSFPADMLGRKEYDERLTHHFWCQLMKEGQLSIISVMSPCFKGVPTLSNNHCKPSQLSN